MPRIFTPAALCLALAYAFPLHAQDRELRDVVITATRSAKDASEAPATVSVVTARDIEDRNIQSADQALTFTPGAYVSRPGGNEPSVMGTHVMLRGIPDASRTLVLVDGQTLNDPYIGTVTWESVPAETIGRIEVVPGPFSSLYGGSAMGGVINIITRPPTQREFSVKAGYGSNDFRNATFVYQDRIGERIGVVFDFAHKEGGGYVKDEVTLKSKAGAGTAVTGAQQTTNVNGETVYLIGDKGRNAWTAQNIGLKAYIDLDRDSRLTLGASQFLYTSRDRNRFNTYLRDAAGNPVSNGNVTIAPGVQLPVAQRSFLTGPDSEIKEYNRYSAEYDRKLGNGASLKATLGYADMPLYNNYIVPNTGATLAGGGATRMLRPSSELSGSVQGSFPFSDRQLVVVGMSAVKRMIDTVTYNIADWREAGATGPVQNRTSGEDTTLALFAQDEIMISDRLTAYLGGRYDFWTTEGFIQQVAATPNPPGTSLQAFGARSQTHVSPKASLVYRPTDATTLRGSIGSSFHTPNLRDTFGWWTPMTGYTFTPNPDLKPETVTATEIGIEQQLSTGGLIRATYFQNRLKNLIYRTDSATLMTQGVENAGKATVKGIELEVRHPVTRGLTAFGNVTFNDPKITENAAKPLTVGKYMTNTPRRMANFGLQGSSGPWSGSFGGHYVGKVYANEENKDTFSGVYGSYDAYFATEAKLSYRLQKDVTLSLSANNLGDRRYYQSALAEGRAFYAELALKF